MFLNDRSLSERCLREEAHYTEFSYGLYKSTHLEL
jgi:hypothetical protein